MTSLSLQVPTRRVDVVFVVGLASLGFVVGLAGGGSPLLGVALMILACVAVVVAARPVACAVLAVPALYGYQSVGLGPALGLSDVLLLAAAVLALPAFVVAGGIRPAPAAFVAFTGYLALLGPSLLAHPTQHAAREVVHRVIIVAGALVVGAWLRSERQVTPALRLLVVVSAFFGLASVMTWFTNGFEPAYPLGYHKNYVGTLLALVLLLLLCARSELRIPEPLRLALGALLVGGVLTSQSRGAILGAAMGGFIWLFAPREGTGVRGRTRIAAAVLAAGFALFTAYSVHQQLVADNVDTSSIGVRRDVEAFSRELWRDSPLVGVGIRYFNTGEYGPQAQAPNNAITSELAEAGLIGAAGFILFHVAVIVALWRRRRSVLGLTALVLVTGRLLHGMFDIYWSSGITPLPFLVAGMALAPAPSDERQRA